MTAGPESTDVARRAALLLDAHRRAIHRRTDRMFTWLLGVQVAAIVISSSVALPDLPVQGVWRQYSAWTISALSLLVGLPAIFLAHFWPGRKRTRAIVSVSQILLSSLLMHVSGAHEAAHLLSFASLAFLAAYRDWRLLLAPTIFAILERWNGGIFWPQFAYGPDAGDPLSFLEFCSWLMIADAFLVVAIRQNQKEMADHARQTAELEENRQSLMLQTQELNRIFAKERAIIEGALDAVIAVDQDDRITTWNCQAERIFGWSADEALGQRFTELVLPPHARDLASIGLMRASHGSSHHSWNHHREHVGLHRSGHEFPIELATTPIRHGDDLTFCAFVRDISDRKEAEHALKASEGQARRLALVAAHTHNAVVITDADQRIEWVNEGFTRITEYRLEEVIGRRPGELLQGPETDRDLVAFMRSRIKAGLPFQTEIKNYSKSGREYWLAIEVQPLRTTDGRLTGFMAIEADITSRKNAEQELLRAKEQAEAANQAKSVFLANMSHEIRTPLTGILGFTDVLRTGNFSPAQAQNYLGIIHSCGSHLLTLLNDILDLSKIEAGRMDFESVKSSPQQIVTDVLSLLRVRAQEKGLALEAVWTTDVPETIHTDPARLRQLLMNLIANAIKFTEHGSVSVLIAARRGPGGWQLEFTIRDTGIGIAPDQLGRIFLPFDQADNSITRKFGGTGLGLAISRHIAMGLGGDITVDSKVGIGSEFKATIGTGRLDNVRFIPLQLSESIQPAESEPSRGLTPTDLTGVRILLVEDGETNRDLISLVLTRANAQVTCACNGKQGVEAAEQGDFDLILMDMQMPVMDGYSAAQYLRSHGSRLPIIALTAHAMRGDKEKCLAAGCTGYLTKPIQIDRLLEAVASHGSAKSETEVGQEADPSWNLEDRPRPPRITSTLPASLPKLREIIEKFIESLQSRRAQMQDAWSDARWNDLAVSAHWLKGAGGTVGFECFTDPARRLEQAARHGEAFEAEKSLHEIDALIDRIASPEPVVV
ncbi:MAG TPA: PAS domain S-box protein [Caulifigura sp.]|nr:PAS domain S-box protein [Caulifigura sp.]